MRPKSFDVVLNTSSRSVQLDSVLAMGRCNTVRAKRAGATGPIDTDAGKRVGGGMLSGGLSAI